MQKRYVLMNKNHIVLNTVYDDELQAFTAIKPINLQFAPPAIAKPDGTTDKRLLNEWWNDRAVPVSRMPRTKAKDELMANLGLSLSDQYWMNPDGLEYNNINLFEHGVSPISMRSPAETGSYSPEASTGGDLPKHWQKENGTWFLVKQGSGTLKQEPYNEAVATALHKRLLKPDEYVPYEVKDGTSVCPNMLRDSEELVTAWDIIKNIKRPNHINDFNHCLGVLSQALADDAGTRLEKMFACDFILANSDRHYRNFGLMRDTDSMRYTRMAPIFDSGSCLWYDKPRLEYAADFDYQTKPFGYAPDIMLAKFHDFSWFDPDKLKGFTEEAAGILSQNPYLPEQRLNAIIKGLSINIDEITRHAESCRAKAL
ncbi:MAG: hypothetical protein NC548_43420 [Lachnospiraceae bacterium]|nr:hypothetical protein [Lachnospiraceae bacterium]